MLALGFKPQGSSVADTGSKASEYPYHHQNGVCRLESTRATRSERNHASAIGREAKDSYALNGYRPLPKLSKGYAVSIS